jgi:hypothetical protein
MPGASFWLAQVRGEFATTPSKLLLLPCLYYGANAASGNRRPWNQIDGLLCWYQQVDPTRSHYGFAFHGYFLFAPFQSHKARFDSLNLFSIMSAEARGK